MNLISSSPLGTVLALGLLVFASNPAHAQDVGADVGTTAEPAPAAAEPAPAAAEPAPAQATYTAPPPPPPAQTAAAAPPPAQAAEQDAPRPPRTPGVFGRNRMRLSVILGSGYGGNDRYLIIGAGVGYYLINGLELALDYQAWTIGSPTYHRLTPGINYVFWMVPKIQPYLGFFYRHTWVQDSSDYGSLGVRGGIYVVPEGPVYFGIGIVYERAIDCDDTLQFCNDYYPEIAIGFSLGG